MEDKLRIPKDVQKSLDEASKKNKKDKQSKEEQPVLPGMETPAETAKKPGKVPKPVKDTAKPAPAKATPGVKPEVAPATPDAPAAGATPKVGAPKRSKAKPSKDLSNALDAFKKPEALPDDPDAINTELPPIPDNADEIHDRLHQQDMQRKVGSKRNQSKLHGADNLADIENAEQSVPNVKVPKVKNKPKALPGVNLGAPTAPKTQAASAKPAVAAAPLPFDDTGAGNQPQTSPQASASGSNGLSPERNQRKLHGNDPYAGLPVTPQTPPTPSQPQATAQQAPAPQVTPAVQQNFNFGVSPAGKAQQKAKSNKPRTPRAAPIPSAIGNLKWNETPISRLYLGNEQKFVSQLIRYTDKVYKNGKAVDVKNVMMPELQNALTGQVYQPKTESLHEAIQLIVEGQLAVAISTDGEWMKVLTPQKDTYVLHTNQDGGWANTGVVATGMKHTAKSAWDKFTGKKSFATTQPQQAQGQQPAAQAQPATPGQAQPQAAPAQAKQNAQQPRAQAQSQQQGAPDVPGYVAGGEQQSPLDRYMRNPDSFLKMMYKYGHSVAKEGVFGGRTIALRWGVEKTVDALREKGVASIDKMASEGEYDIYRVKPFKTGFFSDGAAIYFYVKRSAGYKESLKMDRQLKRLVEASMEELRNEAPEDAFEYGPPKIGKPENDIEQDKADLGMATNEDDIPEIDPDAEVEPDMGADIAPEPEVPDAEPVSDAAVVPNRVLVTQNGKWWTMGWDKGVNMHGQSSGGFLAFLAHGSTGSRWNLDDYGKRTTDQSGKFGGKPADVRQLISIDSGRPTFYSADKLTNVYNVKNWTDDNFQNLLDYIDAQDSLGQSLVEPKPGKDEVSIS